MSIVLPAYNEAEVIARSIALGLGRMEELVADGTVADFELLVIDDGSTDATAAVVEDEYGDDPHVRLLQHARNRGVGAGLRTAIDAARNDVLLSTDADSPVDLMELRRALPLLVEGAHLVVGRRRRYDAEPPLRVFASHAYDRLVRWTLGISACDVNFPFKVMSLTTARTLGLCSDGALVDAEILARAHRRGMHVATLDMDYHARTAGESKTMSVRLLRQLAGELVVNRSQILGDRAT